MTEAKLHFARGSNLSEKAPWNQVPKDEFQTTCAVQKKLALILVLTFSMTHLIAADFATGTESTQVIPEEKEIRHAIATALPLLERSSRGSAEKRKCFTCHSQALPVIALSEARLHGFEVDSSNYERQISHTINHLRKGEENYKEGKGQGGGVDTAGYALWTLEAGQYPADNTVNAVVGFLLNKSMDSAHWQCTSDRPPSESSDFTTTYLAVRALKYYGSQNDRKIVQQRFKSTLQWLLSADPLTTEDRVFHLRSLSYLGASPESLKRFAEKLELLQNPDGGWGQLESMQSDPYATATALVALARTGQVAPTDSAYCKGLNFLLKQQTEFGSWHVKSRSKPFQKYFETGFPHAQDQFISTTATAWSTIALLLALPTQHENKRQGN